VDPWRFVLLVVTTPDFEAINELGQITEGTEEEGIYDSVAKCRLELWARAKSGEKIEMIGDAKWRYYRRVLHHSLEALFPIPPSISCP